MYDYDRGYIRRNTPIYGDLRPARYGDRGDEGYVPIGPAHPLGRRLHALGSPFAPGYDAPLHGYQMRRRRNRSHFPEPAAGRRGRYDADAYRGRYPSRRPESYDARFQPLRANDPLARALRDDTEDLVTDYLRGERYGDEYARSLGVRIHGPGDRARDVARRISRGEYGPDR